MSLEQINVKLLDWWPKDGDKDVAHAAWASTFDQEKLEARSQDDVFRIVKQIVEHVHDTPKEGVMMRFFISCPIYCERQFDKYRMTLQSQDFQIEWFEAKMGRDHITQNELSGRYRTIPERPYSLPNDVKQILENVNKDVINEYENMMEQQHLFYKKCLDSFPIEWKKGTHPNNKDYKRVREVFRGVLGTGYFTDMRIVCNLNAFEHIMNQRLEFGTQLESRYVAYLMLKEVLNNEVARKTIEHMMVKNKWVDFMSDIEQYLK